MATPSIEAPPTLGTDIAPSSLPPTAGPETTQIIPGTTVIGTGTTGDVWSYTIPDVTSVIPISAPTSAAPNPPADTLVVTTVVVSGTTVTGGMETGVPWSYTIPDVTFLSSVLVPIPSAPTSSPLSEPLSSSALITESIATPVPSSSTPSLSNTFTAPPPDPSQTQSQFSSSASSIPSVPPAAPGSQSSNAALSGGIVAGVLGALLLVIFGAALCLCLRLRRRRRAGGSDWDKPREKGVGVIWGKGWGRNKKDRRAWTGARPGMTGGDSGGSSGLGSRTRLNPDPEAQETTERSRPGARPRIKYPYPAPTPDAPVPQDNPASPDDAYPPNSSEYPQLNSDPNTRTTTPSIKQPRSIPPPTQYVYAPPPPPPREPDRQPAPLPDMFRSASPPLVYPTSLLNRPTSPHGNRPTSPTFRTPGPNRLSKQRANPSASAVLRHMARGASLRRSRAGPPPSTSGSDSTARPGISTLPSFIRERQFSPGRDGLKSSSESALFTPRTSHTPLPLSPRSTHVPLSPGGSYSHLPHLRYPNYAMSRDGLLSPPPSFPRDRYSQMTSTTRSGGTGWSGATRRSADSRYTGRSMGSRATGRSDRSGGTGGGLGRVVEGRGGWDEDRR
ncbi:transmembrane protein [Ceratobasidium sp. AG-Ba]|nr:transmembrane protein [Ceratobasidium sp. AG-Ba]